MPRYFSAPWSGFCCLFPPPYTADCRSQDRLCRRQIRLYIFKVSVFHLEAIGNTVQLCISAASAAVAISQHGDAFCCRLTSFLISSSDRYAATRCQGQRRLRPGRSACKIGNSTASVPKVWSSDTFMEKSCRAVSIDVLPVISCSIYTPCRYYKALFPISGQLVSYRVGGGKILPFSRQCAAR